jgi:hypothetical protein
MRERYKEFRRRSFEEWERKEQAQLRAVPVPLYALPPAFQGPRTIETYQIAAGGLGLRDVDTDTVHYQIIHGNRLERPLQFLIVASSKHPEPPRRPTPLRHYLWQRVVTEMAATTRSRWRVARVSTPKPEDVGGPERPVVVPIDGAPRTFTLIEAGEAQVAELNLPDHRIILQAHRWPVEEIELVTVTDLAPYLADWDRLIQQRRTALGLDEPDR